MPYTDQACVAVLHCHGSDSVHHNLIMPPSCYDWGYSFTPQLCHSSQEQGTCQFCLLPPFWNVMWFVWYYCWL